MNKLLANLTNALWKRIAITFALLVIPAIIGLLFMYEVIKIDWVSTMEIQPSFRPMEDPLPLPPGSVPIQGAAYLEGQGAPANPVPADALSLQRAQPLYDVNCAVCHGPQGKGDGPLAPSLRRKPADLTGANVKGVSDGDIFFVITAGVPGLMPPLRENLEVRDRWDVVNYVRSLQK